jgi:hypothetical protein
MITPTPYFTTLQTIYERSPRRRRANCISLGMIVTRLPWIAQRLVSEISHSSHWDRTFKQGDEVSFNSFLEGADGRRLESKISLEVLSNFADKALERKLADQELSGLLISTDFTKSNRTGAVTMGLLDTSGSLKVSP